MIVCGQVKPFTVKSSWTSCSGKLKKVRSKELLWRRQLTKSSRAVSMTLRSSLSISLTCKELMIMEMILLSKAVKSIESIIDDDRLACFKVFAKSSKCVGLSEASETLISDSSEACSSGDVPRAFRSNSTSLLGESPTVLDFRTRTIASETSGSSAAKAARMKYERMLREAAKDCFETVSALRIIFSKASNPPRRTKLVCHSVSVWSSSNDCTICSTYSSL
mmetsp:Transcript_8203/g.16164  ORF Transcript_8203/g.16164 Transcript_8203/m.16164 type:complete len:221 (+) Transcript_8203:5877-6539(+)